MLEVRVTISCPDLVEAAKILKGATDSAQQPAPVLQQTNPAPVATQQPTQQPTACPAPVQPTPNIAQAAPLAQAPTYTQADIAKAGADLFTARPDLQPQVLALLSQYGCQSVMDLKPEHFGTFATALRGMGAKI